MPVFLYSVYRRTSGLLLPVMYFLLVLCIAHHAFVIIIYSITVRGTVIAINILLTNKIIIFSRGSSTLSINQPKTN